MSGLCLSRRAEFSLVPAVSALAFMGWETELDWVRGLRCDERNIVAVMK